MTERVIRVLAPAKLNLGLAVLGKRPDGYHNLLTIFQAIDLYDRLEFRDADAGIDLRIIGDPSVPEGEENLIVRATNALARKHGLEPKVQIRLEKNIPAGAGLGGGSSDAAGTLLGLEALWGLDPDPIGLKQLALELGSDVPFFLAGGTARGEGRGEILTPLPSPPAFAWLLAVPEFRFSTREVFERLPPSLTGSHQELRMLEQSILHGDTESFAQHVVNDLLPGVVRIEPRLAHIREELRRCGATAVGLTGSGSAMFALFRSQGDVARIIGAGSSFQGARLLACAPVLVGASVVTENDDHRNPDPARG